MALVARLILLMGASYLVQLSESVIGGFSYKNIILMLDIVFSIDSVITAVGLTNHLMIIYASVVVSFVLVLVFSGAIAAFVQKHITLKILALSFLITIGVSHATCF